MGSKPCHRDGGKATEFHHRLLHALSGARCHRPPCGHAALQCQALDTRVLDQAVWLFVRDQRDRARTKWRACIEQQLFEHDGTLRHAFAMLEAHHRAGRRHCVTTSARRLYRRKVLFAERLRSIVITSNRVVQDWGRYLGDATMATTLLDRLMHRCAMLEFEGKSDRLKEASARLVVASEPP